MAKVTEDRQIREIGRLTKERREQRQWLTLPFRTGDEADGEDLLVPNPNHHHPPPESSSEEDEDEETEDKEGADKSEAHSQ